MKNNNSKQKSTHGGPNRNQGRRAQDGGKRITISVCLSPKNLEFLEAMGKEKNNWLNLIIEKERLQNSV